jgi:hypothetical protein
MSPKERERFMTWYETVRHGPFDFHKEMESYCDNDVVILGEGCLRFREEVIKDAGIDPWSCTTIASACMKTYRMSTTVVSSTVVNLALCPRPCVS